MTKISKYIFEIGINSYQEYLENIKSITDIIYTYNPVNNTETYDMQPPPINNDDYETKKSCFLCKYYIYKNFARSPLIIYFPHICDPLFFLIGMEQKLFTKSIWVTYSLDRHIGFNGKNFEKSDIECMKYQGNSKPIDILQLTDHFKYVYQNDPFTYKISVSEILLERNILDIKQTLLNQIPKKMLADAIWKKSSSEFKKTHPGNWENIVTPNDLQIMLRTLYNPNLINDVGLYKEITGNDKYIPNDKYRELYSIKDADIFILKIPTGYGKTVYTSSFLYDSGILFPKKNKILVTEPLIGTAKAIEFTSFINFGSLGYTKFVGSHAQGIDSTTLDTTITYMTEGSLLGSLLNNTSFTDDYSCFIIDEYHELKNDANIILSILMKKIMDTNLKIETLKNFEITGDMYFVEKKNIEIKYDKLQQKLENKKFKIIILSASIDVKNIVDIILNMFNLMYKRKLISLTNIKNNLIINKDLKKFNATNKKFTEYEKIKKTLLEDDRNNVDKYIKNENIYGLFYSVPSIKKYLVKTSLKHLYMYYDAIKKSLRDINEGVGTSTKSLKEKKQGITDIVDFVDLTDIENSQLSYIFKIFCALFRGIPIIGPKRKKYYNYDIQYHKNLILFLNQIIDAKNMDKFIIEIGDNKNAITNKVMLSFFIFLSYYPKKSINDTINELEFLDNKNTFKLIFDNADKKIGTFSKTRNFKSVFPYEIYPTSKIYNEDENTTLNEINIFVNALIRLDNDEQFKNIWYKKRIIRVKKRLIDIEKQIINIESLSKQTTQIYDILFEKYIDKISGNNSVTFQEDMKLRMCRNTTKKNVNFIDFFDYTRFKEYRYNEIFKESKFSYVRGMGLDIEYKMINSQIEKCKSYFSLDHDNQKSIQGLQMNTKKSNTVGNYIDVFYGKNIGTINYFDETFSIFDNPDFVDFIENNNIIKSEGLISSVSMVIFLPKISDVHDMAVKMSENVDKIKNSFGKIKEYVSLYVYEIYSKSKDLSLAQKSDRRTSKKPLFKTNNIIEYKVEIFIGTNAIETGITLHKCFCIIDSGRYNESIYVPYFDANFDYLSFITYNSYEQRRGRAGRDVDNQYCRYFGAYTKSEFEGIVSTRKNKIHECFKTNSDIYLKAYVKEFPISFIYTPPYESIFLSLQKLINAGALLVVSNDKIKTYNSDNDYHTLNKIHTGFSTLTTNYIDMIVVSFYYGVTLEIISLISMIAHVSTPTYNPKFNTRKSDHLYLILIHKIWLAIDTIENRKQFYKYFNLTEEEMTSVNNDYIDHINTLKSLGLQPQSNWDDDKIYEVLKICLRKAENYNKTGYYLIKDVWNLNKEIGGLLATIKKTFAFNNLNNETMKIKQFNIKKTNYGRHEFEECIRGIMENDEMYKKSKNGRLLREMDKNQCKIQLKEKINDALDQNFYTSPLCPKKIAYSSLSGEYISSSNTKFYISYVTEL